MHRLGIIVPLVSILLLAGGRPALAEREDGHGGRREKAARFAPNGPKRRGDALDRRLARLLRRHDLRPASDGEFLASSDELVQLGNLLFYDKELSGNRDVSCATCHHALMATADGLSLPAGVGGVGLSTARRMGEGRERVPRNAPEVFNRGHAAFTSMFWDSRIEEDPTHPSGFLSPAGRDLPPGFRHVIEVQAMFPVTSADEMRGQPRENEIADAVGDVEIWTRLMERLLAIDEYVALFEAAYPGIPLEDLGFEHAARAIAAFEASRWRSDDSPFDRYLRGERGAMSEWQKRGAILFYGRAGCAECHSGLWQTDLDHHAIAMPQLGPGKGHGPDGDEDTGRGDISGDDTDLYAFRTPPLRNVALTGPYGHAGAYRALEEVVRHHLDPERSLRTWDRDRVLLPAAAEGDEDDPFRVMDDRSKVDAIAAANELGPRKLSERETDLLLEFLGALTDPSMLDLRSDVPLRVPSGLPIAD
ncbi:MAG: cytochrome-c peroxidase [bacterium]